MPGEVSGGNMAAYSVPDPWTDPTTALPVFRFPSVAIECTVAPTTPYTIEGGPGPAATSTRTAVSNTSAGISTTTTISAVGRYDLPGGGYIKLTGGTGGTFFVSASA